MSREVPDLLETWFARHARDLPWRRRRTGYVALVAEAMLQQTQVARVVDRYRVFMRRFPSVRSLAAADEQEVLAAWQGLGYYRRARNLHAAAKRIVMTHAGRVPRDAATLRELPGVGRYTAGAIASIVYDAVEPIVDGNVHRVLARLHARPGSLAEAPVARWTWATAEALVRDARSPGALNEALMELGATICTPRRPRCDACPIAPHCRARAGERQEEIPAAKPAARRRQVHFHTVVIHRAGRVLLERRPDDGLWSSMWQTPTVEDTRVLPASEIESRLPCRVTDLVALTGFDHHTTHRRIRFHVYNARSCVRRGTWRAPGEAHDLPMSNAMRRVLGLGLGLELGPGSARGEALKPASPRPASAPRRPRPSTTGS